MSVTSSTWRRPYARYDAASFAPFTPRRRKHFVGDEDVVVVAPRGVRAANEAGATRGLDVAIERIEVVLVLRHQLRVRRTAALDAVADVENDEAVVPVAERTARPSWMSMSCRVRPASGRLVRHCATSVGLVRIVDVDDVHRAGAVVREEHEGAVLLLLIDERRVHTGGDALGELGDDLRVDRVFSGRDDDAVLAIGGALAGEDDDLAVGRAHDVVDATGVGDDRVGDRRVGGITDVDGVEDIATAAAAQEGVLAIGHDPDFLGGEAGTAEAAHDGDGATDIARLERDRGIGAPGPEARGDEVVTRLRSRRRHRWDRWHRSQARSSRSGSSRKQRRRSDRAR